MPEWELGRFPVRLSVVVTIAVTALLLIPIAYDTYLAPLTIDELSTTLVVIEPLDDGNTTVPGLLGSSVDWTDNANGLYNEVSGLLNPAPVGELIGLQPSYLRFPATRLSQVYNWTKGVGNKNERGENPSHGPKPQVSTFGTDEFYRLVDHTETRAVMVVNAHDGTAEMGGEWVSYCNDHPDRGKGRERAANGYDTPYDINYWEFGYEPFHTRYWKDKPPKVDAGTLYAQRLHRFSQQMKSVDTTIQLGAWMVLHPDVELTSADSAWNQNFINEINSTVLVEGKPYPTFDYIVISVKLPDIPLLLKGRDLYSYGYAKAWKGLRDDLASLRGFLKEKVYWDPDIPIAVASFGPDFGNEGWNTQFPANAGSALLTADMAMQFLSIAMDGGQRSLLYACYGELNTPSYPSLMINPDFDAAYLETWGRSPNYLAFQMCTRVQGGLSLGVSELDPLSYDVPVEQELPGLDNVPIISAFATSDLDRTSVTMLVLNRDLDRPVRCRIDVDVSGMSGPLEVRARTIEFPSLLSNNLAWETVKAPIPSTSAMEKVPPDEVFVTVPPATLALVLVDQAGVG